MAAIETRHNADGTIGYRAKVRLKGFPSQSATFERKTDAKEWAKQTEASMRQGRHFKTAEAKKHTVGELNNLRWSDVDWQRRVITLHDTKNKERRLLPLAHYALQLMEEHNKVRNIASDLVFPSSSHPMKPWDSRSSWQSALQKANIQNFRFHDLRHSCASYLAMNGASIAEIAEVLGHKTLQMVKRYAHLSEAHTAKVVQRMNERIFG